MSLVRRVALPIVLLAVAFALIACPVAASRQAPAFAESAAVDEVPTAEIAFNNLNLSSGGLYRSLSVRFDRSAAIGRYGATADKKIDLALARIAALAAANGFQTSAQTDGVEIVTERYDSLTDYYIASGATGYDPPSSDSGAKVEKKGFFNVYTTSTQTVFADISDTSLIGVVRGYVLDAGVAPDDLRYVYNYGTKYAKTTIDSNATEIYYDRSLGIYVHEVRMNADGTDFVFEIRQTVPNAALWYGLVLGVFLLAAALALAVYLGRKRHQRI